jgi:glycerol kinase
MTQILSIDQGTSSSRAIVFDTEGNIQAIEQEELSLTYPQSGWVEQNPQELVDNTIKAVQKVLSDERFSSISGIGISNQRETTIVWERKTGAPIYNAIVWQDRRTADFCDSLKRDGLEDEICIKTGLLLDPYFSATKIKWILDHVEGAKQKAINGDLCFGTVDSYVLWHLTGGAMHLTDVTNASRTMLYNIHTCDWDDDLLKIFDIPRVMLPEVCDNIYEFGQLDSGLFGRSLVVGGIAGDQQSAMIGQGCIESGMIKSTYGTGCFALTHTGEKAVRSSNRLLTTIASRICGKVEYALEGSIFNAGTAVQFLRDNFDFFTSAKQTSDMAKALRDNGGVFFVPAFTGLGAPHWRPDAKGLIYGLSRDTGKAHIVRAALEAQAYQTRDLLEAMEKDSCQKTAVLRADGGLVGNDFMCQFLSDILQVAIEIPRVSESTAWGAACLAGVQCGVFENIADATSRWQLDRRYDPKLSAGDVDTLYTKWRSVVEKTC